MVDLETTGFDRVPRDGWVDGSPGHMPVEVGWCDLVPAQDLLGAADWTQATVGEPGALLLATGRAVPPEASAVHHLIACDLVGARPWREGLMWRVGGITRPVAFAAHSARMQRQWCTPDLVGEAPWVCTWKCALRAWPEAPGHSNQILRYWLRANGAMRGLDRGLAAPAHRAAPDAYVTAHLLRELLAVHPLAVLRQWSDEPALLVRVPFGRRPEEGGSRGLKWREVDAGLLHWVLDKDFSEEVLHTARVELARRAAEAQEAAGDGADRDDPERPF